MSDMIAYTTALLSVISDWLNQPPMIYFVGCAVACFVIKMLKQLLSI